MAALEQLLAQDKLYAKQLKSVGRRWFTQKILQYAQVTNPANVLTEATNLLTTAKTLVTARLDAARGSLVDDLKRGDRNEIRARIVYGLLGIHPGIFLTPTGQNDLLDFIVERRFRSIQRMLSFVNPNRKRQIMAYPPAGPITAQVSTQTRTLWEGVNVVDNTKRYPFLLTQLGKQSPKDAIEKLFLKNVNIDDRTRVDCPAAAMTVHLDALLVAKNPHTLATHLANENNEYLAIDHAYGPWRLNGGGGFTGWTSTVTAAGANVDVKMLGVPHDFPAQLDLVDKDGRQSIEVTNVTRHTPIVDDQVLIESSVLAESTMRVTQLGRPVPVGAHLADTRVPSFHAVSDPRPDKSLFDQSFINEEDLQVGDHIYVANHPIHRTRIGSTIWNGEHSFVLDPWQGTRTKMLVTGHGVHTLTVAQVVWVMLEEINAFLEVTRKIVDRWLAMPATTVPVAEEASNNTLRAALGRILLLTAPAPFNGTFRVFNLPALTYRKIGKDRTYPAYWVMDLDGTVGPTPIDRRKILIFDYDPERKTAKQWPPAGFTNQVAVLRHDALVNLSTTPKHQYAVSYIDDNAGKLVYMPLYYPIGTKKGKPVRLDYNDIQDSVVLGTETGKFFVVKPQVRSTQTYLAFLKQIGAIL
ncbi:MAG: hypothetical protein LC794_11465 [Acidobacteria bacterium]|nr:hypothetical protein [Acidobacteriota bacterium]MCA1627285.1 hypothetical protein [Acidobacteriota bacterium]